MTQLETMGILALAALAFRALVLGLAWAATLWAAREWRRHPSASRNTPESDSGK